MRLNHGELRLTTCVKREGIFLEVARCDVEINVIRKLLINYIYNTRGKKSITNKIRPNKCVFRLFLPISDKVKN